MDLADTHTHSCPANTSFGPVGQSQGLKLKEQKEVGGQWQEWKAGESLDFEMLSRGLGRLLAFRQVEGVDEGKDQGRQIKAEQTASGIFRLRVDLLEKANSK